MNLHWAEHVYTIAQHENNHRLQVYSLNFLHKFLVSHYSEILHKKSHSYSDLALYYKMIRILYYLFECRTSILLLKLVTIVLCWFRCFINKTMHEHNHKWSWHMNDIVLYSACSIHHAAQHACWLMQMNTINPRQTTFSTIALPEWAIT